MWPTLISAGPVTIYSFGVLLFLGVFFGGFCWWRKGKEEGLDEEVLIDAWLVMGLAAILGGRIGQILLNWEWFSGSWYKMIFITKYPGLNYEFAWLGALLALVWLIKKNEWKLWQVLEMSVSSWLTVEIFGWLGVFLGGSSLGIITNGWWGLAFPGVEGKRWPVQILWGLSLWLLFQLVKKWEKEYRTFEWYKQENGEAEPGFINGIYLLGLGFLRFGLGFMTEAGKQWGLSFSQWFGVILIAAGGLILLLRSGKLKRLAKVKPELKTISSKPKMLRKKRGFDFK